MTEVLRQEKPVARKEHRCLFCGAVIKKGEKYQHDVYVTDGDLDEQRMHFVVMTLLLSSSTHTMNTWMWIQSWNV